MTTQDFNDAVATAIRSVEQARKEQAANQETSVKTVKPAK